MQVRDSLQRLLPARFLELNLQALALGARRARAQRGLLVNVVIIVAGVIGLAVAAYALVDVAVSAGRRRRLLDVVLVIARRGGHHRGAPHLGRPAAAVVASP